MADKILVKTRVGTRLMTRAAFKIAQKFGVVEISKKPEELTVPPRIAKALADPKNVPPVITAPANIVDPLLESEKKLMDLSAFKKSLVGKNKADLTALAKEKGYPEDEYVKLNKADLYTYLVDKHEGANK